MDITLPVDIKKTIIQESTEDMRLVGSFSTDEDIFQTIGIIFVEKDKSQPFTGEIQDNSPLTKNSLSYQAVDVLSELYENTQNGAAIPITHSLPLIKEHSNGKIESNKYIKIRRDSQGTADKLEVPGDNSIRIVDPDMEGFDRTESVIDLEALQEATVLILGLGTGGGIVAEELAKAGVGNFELIDFDRLETHNIVRHVCSHTDIGRLKTDAVADKIASNNPNAKVNKHTFDLTEKRAPFRDLLSHTDLVIVASDTEKSRTIANIECLNANVPAIYGAAYERAAAGEVIRVLPGETACYNCISGMPSKLDNIQRNEDGSIDYGKPTDEEDISMPFLSIDVGFIANAHARFALSTLIDIFDIDSEVPSIEYDILFWGNRPGAHDGLIEAPFGGKFPVIPPRDDCSICGEQGLLHDLRD